MTHSSEILKNKEIAARKTGSKKAANRADGLCETQLFASLIPSAKKGVKMTPLLRATLAPMQGPQPDSHEVIAELMRTSRGT